MVCDPMQIPLEGIYVAAPLKKTISKKPENRNR
jgi:hypothetical protein